MARLPLIEDMQSYAESVVDTVREPLLLLDTALCVRSANRAFYRTFHVRAEETEDRLIYDLGNRQWDIPSLRTLLEEVLPQNTHFDGFEVEHVFGAIGRKVMLLNARRFIQQGNKSEFILLAIEDITDRRHAEEERREMETRFTSLVKNVKDHAIFTMNREGAITSWNVEAERILGHSETDVLGQQFSIIFTPEDRQAEIPGRELRRAREAGRAEDVRWHLRKDGSRFWALGVVTPMHDADDRLTGFSKILRDMTESKIAERELQKARSEAELQVLERTAELRAANDGLRKEIEDRRMTERRMNAQHATTRALAESQTLEAAMSTILQSICQNMDWSCGAVWVPDLVGQKLVLIQLSHSSSAEINEFLMLSRQTSFLRGEGLPGRVWESAAPIWVPDVAHDSNLIRSRAATDCHLHAALGFPILNDRDFQGVIEFFSQRIEPPSQELLAMMAAIGSQIGQFIEKRQMADALDKEREFFKAVLENAQDGIVACDSKGALTFFNRAAREFHGKAKQPLPAENWNPELDLYQVDGKTRLAKQEIPLYRAFQGEVVRDVEIVISPAEGVARTMQTTARAITDASGNRLGAVVVMHDVTERNLLEQQLRQSQKMDAFGQLAGGIAHDFNNLLTIISGYSELVLTALPAGDRNRDPVWQIHQAGERAALLTRQLLTFSRKQLVQPKILDLNAVVANTEKMLGRLIGEDIALKAVVASGLSPVRADPGQIEQVIMNLVVNARDAMPLGGSITIETANIDLDASYGKTHAEVEPGHYVMLAVSDTGCGMSEEIMKHAFEPFFTTKEVGQGTGIGLAIVFGIVREAGGHIWLYSEVGRGTTFKIYLPAVEADAASTQSSETITPALNGFETILIVEDEEAVRRMTRFSLLANGYAVLEATDVNNAITICKDHPEIIHLLISDVVMPGMGGRQLAGLLTDMRPNMRVLFVSGYTDDAVVRHGVLEAEVAFLQKPFSMESLCRKVRTVLDGVA
jgi:PAS domain S-box-containing protein